MEQCKEILRQMGGGGIHGALAYIGGHNVIGKQRPGGGYPDPSYVNSNGLVEHETGIQFHVNGQKRRQWWMAVSYEPSDTYTVRLLRAATPSVKGKTGAAGELLDEREDVYCDALQTVVEQMYDRAIERYNDGMIHIG